MECSLFGEEGGGDWMDGRTGTEDKKDLAPGKNLN